MHLVSTVRHHILSNRALFAIVLGFALVYCKIVVFLALTDSLSANERGLFHFAYMLLWAAFSALCWVPLFVCKPKAATWLSALLCTLWSVLLLADLWYYRGFSMFLSCYTLQQSDNLHGLWSSIFSMARSIDLLFVLDLPVLFWLIKGSARPTSFTPKLRLSAAILFVLCLCCIGVGNSLHARFRSNPLFYTCFVQNKTMHNLSPLGFHLWDAWEYLQERNSAELSAEEVVAIRQTLASQAEADSSSLRGTFAGYNLLVLQVESLEDCVLDQTVDGQFITPELNALEQHALRFTNVYEQVANGTSSDADLLLNTGLYPPRKGCAFFRVPHNSYRSLPVLLGELGYHTVAMKADPASYYNWKDALQHMGFAQCVDAESYAKTDMIGLMQSDSSVLFQSLAHLQAQQQPWYGFVVTETTHSPFILPTNKQELRLRPQLHNTIQGDYVQAVHYVDKHIGALLRSMEERHLLEHTLVVITGDHTSLHKYYRDRVRAMSGAEPWWSQDEPRVPLLIYHPKLQGRTVPTIGGQVDILATLCSLLGVPQASYWQSCLSKNLLSTQRNYCVLSDGRVIGDSSAARVDELNRLLMMSDKIICSSYFGSKP